MKNMTLTVLLALACATPLACEQSHGGGPAATGSAATPDLAGGTQHDPPIAVKDVPAGHWYCDMGTVHYSRAAEADGKCALCGMKLKHKE
jgi:hypothetical protein